MNENIIDKEEELKILEIQKRFKSYLKVIAVVGIGAGLYGFKLGRQSGFRKGVRLGHIAAAKDMVDAWREHTEELIQSRGKGD